MSSDSVKTFSCGASQGPFAPAHNKRLPSAMKGKKNYDPSLSYKNVVLLDRNIRDVYDELFEPEYQKHIDKLLHGKVTGIREAKTAQDMKKLIPYVYSPDEEYHRLVFTRTRARKSEYKKTYEGCATYYDYLNKANSKSKGNAVVEEVLQVGNEADHLNEEEAIQVYSRTLELMKERYGSNLEFVQAVIHFDETGDLSQNEEVRGTPHMHVSFIPYYHAKSGMPLQYGFGEARKELGFETDRTGIDTYEQFHEALRELQREALKELGYDRHIVGDHSGHDSPEIHRRKLRNEEAIREQETQRIVEEVREGMKDYRSDQKKAVDEQIADYKEEMLIEADLEIASYEADKKDEIDQTLKKAEKISVQLKEENRSLSEQINDQKRELESARSEFKAFREEAAVRIEQGMSQAASQLPPRTSLSSLVKGLDEAIDLFENSPKNVKGDLLVDPVKASKTVGKLKSLKTFLKPLEKAFDFIKDKGKSLIQRWKGQDQEK